MDIQLELFLAKSTTITVFSDVDTPSPGFSTTTVSRAKEELGPGWAVDDVYPPLAELRRALLTDEEWAAMSSWEKDVWEMFYRPDWERLACIEQILVDTPAVQRAQRHAEILEALHNLGTSASKRASVVAVPVVTASSAIIEEGPEVASSALTGFITTVPMTCSTDCSPQQSTDAPVLVATSTEYVLGLNNIQVAAVPLAMTVGFPAVTAPTDSTPTVQLQPLYNDSEYFMPTSSQCVATKVHVHRPVPWPSFMGVHVDGVAARPLPWPSFGKIDVCEFPSDAIKKASRRCISDSFPATLCDVIKFSVTDFSKLKESVVLNLMRSSSNSVRCDEWVLSPWDPGQADVSAFAKVFYSQAIFDIYLKKLMLQSMKISGSNGSVSLVVLVHWSTGAGYLAWISDREKKISYVVVVKEKSEPKLRSEHHITELEQLTLDLILIDLQDGCVDITKCNITTCFRYSMLSIHVKELQGACVSAQLQWGNLASVLSCGLIQLGKLCLNWKFARSAIGRTAWLIHIQSVALNNMELWWFSTVLWTETASMFGTGFSMQMNVTCLVQPILLLTHVYELSILAPTMFSFAWENMDCIFNKVSYRMQQYTDLSYFGIHAGLHSFGKSTSRALMQHSNKGSYRFAALVLSYMGFPAVYAPVHLHYGTLSGNSCVCLQELHLDRSGIKGAAVDRIIFKMNPCQSKWSESILTHHSASEGTICESKMEFYILGSYTVVQYTLSWYDIKTGLHSFNVSTRRTLIQDARVAIRKHSGILVQCMKAPCNPNSST